MAMIERAGKVFELKIHVKTILLTLHKDFN